MSAALLTSDTPHWLVLTLIALVAGAYLACGLPTLAERARVALARRRGRAPVPARALTSVGKEVSS